MGAKRFVVVAAFAFWVGRAESFERGAIAIAAHPEGRRVALGAECLVEAVIKGDESLAFTWFHRRPGEQTWREIRPGVSVGSDVKRFDASCQAEPDGTVRAGLAVRAFAVPDDEGDYRCEVRDATGQGPVLSTRTASIVGQETFRLAEQPHGADVLVGGTWTGRMSVSGGIGPFRYEWRFDSDGGGPGAPVPVGLDIPWLHIPYVTLTQAGSYCCVATDLGAGGTTPSTICSEEVCLNVAEPLTVTGPTCSLPRSSTGEVVIYGGERVFECWVDLRGGHEPYVYEWRRDDAPVSGATTQRLRIDAPSPEHSGGYRCAVTDATGTCLETSDAIRLASTPHLSIVEQPQGETIKVYEPFTFRAIAEGGYGERHYQWKHDADGDGPEPPRNIANSPDAPVYMIPKLGLEHSGYYVCVINDSYLDVEVTDPAPLEVEWKL